MNLLKEKIIERIRKEGPVTFETFMEMALYEPMLGYYASEKTEIGKSGDFYTSTHLHSAFGAMIGRQIGQMREIMGKPADFGIVEIGAGAGYMCKDILDSFPVHLIEMDDELKEIFVMADKNILIEIKRTPSTHAVLDYMNEFSIVLTEGYRTEINLRIKDWLRSVNEALSEGFILTIDYGYPAWDYYNEDRNRGALLCYYRHQLVEDPYINIGDQDITAHVNFSSVKKWGEDLGLKTLGFCQQGTFLISLGIDDIIQELYKDSHDYLFEVAKIKRLIFPGTLGESHKVLIQYKGKGFPELKGFSIKNQADKL